MQGEPPTKASTPTGAVFLSYASQDAEAAKRICDALRSAGIEVWFDQSELRGGEAWDRQITQQIRECALFVAVISANTDARDEGYFRREWRVAVERTRDLADDRAFLLPVVIDGTPDAKARVPDKFHEVQWSRSPGGETPPAFVERISRLLSPSHRQVPLVVAAASSTAPAQRQLAAAQFGRPALLVALLVAALGIGYFALDKFVLSRRPLEVAQTAAPTAAAAPAPSAIPEKSVAVLPFVNMSSDKEQEYFSDGLTEELIDLLSQVQDLRVPARTSSFFFKGKQATIAEIAKALSVANVLEGSVRKAGNSLRVTVQLIRADNGYHLWSKTYDGDAKDIFKVQDQVAAAVVEVLKAKLAPARPIASFRTANPEAYNQYLLGRQFDRRGTIDGRRRAGEAYGKAIALDPNYAAAYAGLAVAEDWSGDPAGLRRAEAAADKAIALGPEEADGYAARGSLRTDYSWDWAGGQSDLAKALAINPADSSVQSNYGELLKSLGRLPEAIATLKKATELDPLWSLAWAALGKYLMFSGDYPAAGEALRRALEIQPDADYARDFLGKLQLLEGKAVESLATSRRNGFEALRLTGIAMAEHTLGHANESQQALDELIAKAAQQGAFQIAEVFAWRGDYNKAFDWLERARRQGDGGLPDVKVDPLLASLRGDPRYAALLRKLNLPE